MTQQDITGILLTNLGTPDAPTPAALRRYLSEFLHDRRVVDLPRVLWCPILHGIILRIRPRRSAKAYAKIWQPEGSPLMIHAKNLSYAIGQRLQELCGAQVKVALGMRYGNPSIASALDSLGTNKLKRLLVLPLYPQYAGATVASTLDAVHKAFKSWQTIPDLRFIHSYAKLPAYIQALAASVKQHWQEHPRGQKLLMSFHGIPERYVRQGDIYADECYATAQALAQTLDLEPQEWQVVFQSRFGREPWLQPYCDKTLEQLPQQDIKSVDVICPGFSADCLETLEEIAMVNKAMFLGAGGKRFHYIPALNDNASHTEALITLLLQHMQGWPIELKELQHASPKTRETTV